MLINTVIFEHKICMGWVNENVTNFRAAAKFVKATFPKRFPEEARITRNANLPRVAVSYSPNDNNYLARTTQNMGTTVSVTTMPVNVPLNLKLNNPLATNVGYKNFITYLTV